MPICIFKTFIPLIIIKFLRHTGNTYAFSVFPLLLILSTFWLLPFYLLPMTQNLYHSHVKHVSAILSMYSATLWDSLCLPFFTERDIAPFSGSLYYLWMGIKYLKPARITNAEECHVFTNLYFRHQSPSDTPR